MHRLGRILAEAREGGALIVANTARAQAYAAAARWLVHAPSDMIHILHERDTADRWSARWVFQRHGSLVAVGANTARTYRQALPGVRVGQINNFLDPRDLAAAVASRHSPVDPCAPGTLGALGRLIPEKGFVELVEELASIPTAWRRLLIAGPAQDVAYVARLERQIIDLGLAERVALLGAITNLASFFASIDALVVPSVADEGQPTVILEALAYGRPVVVRDPLMSPDFDNLPIAAYHEPAGLVRALQIDRMPASAELLAGRFGPEQAIEGIERAARRATRPTAS
jgi:glycosyltransferase involved in cell wall biosynthesis